MDLYPVQIFKVSLPDFLAAYREAGLLVQIEVIAMTHAVLGLNGVIQDAPGPGAEFKKIVNCNMGVKMSEMIGHIDEMTHDTGRAKHPEKFYEDIL